MRNKLMCGIAGIFDLNGERAVDRDALTRMTNALAHRGPDGEGYFFAPGLGLGHRRLAIIDKIGGAQPFQTQSGKAVLTYNGEIYNYQALAKRITGISLKTRSDTELLAEGLAAKGMDFLHELHGMFAFGFFESDKSRLTLARDRLGERPLYYAETHDGFLLFASEITALLASRLINTALDPRAVADYFYYGYVPDPKTIYRGLYKLAPAHKLILARGQTPRMERYWRPVFAQAQSASLEEAAILLRQKIDLAVQRQLVSDMPLGAFLSGGVDSASILSAMAQNDAKPITCTIGFKGAHNDERAPAREIAEKFGAQHHETLTDCDSTTLIDKVAASFGEPFADASALPSFLISKLARQHVSVALTGDGGDEVFAGYRRYPFFLAEEKMRELAPAPLRAGVFGPLGAAYPKLDWAPRYLRAKTTFQAMARSSADGYAAAVAINLPSRIKAIFSSDFKRTLSGYEPESVITDAMDGSGVEDPLARAQYADLMTWLPGRMLVKSDRMAMAHGLETRPPLLDHTIVEWAGALPAEYKLQAMTGKRILKEAFSPRLGADFVSRKKQGFAPPLTEWLRRRDNNPALRLNASQRWRESGLFDEKAVETMIASHRTGAVDCAQEIWSVIMFDAFLRNTN